MPPCQDVRIDRNELENTPIGYCMSSSCSKELSTTLILEDLPLPNVVEKSNQRRYNVSHRGRPGHIDGKTLLRFSLCHHCFIEHLTAMLSTLLFAFERVWAQVFIYLSLIPIILLYARYLVTPVLAYALLIAATLYIGQLTTSAVLAEQDIDARGQRAPRVKDYAPFGMGTLIQALYYFSNWRNHEFWWHVFLTYGNPKNPYTVESITLGQRLVFTADEENIKAILATQFQDFGKGPQFRKEWKEFLGLSQFYPNKKDSCCSTDNDSRHIYYGWGDLA